MSAELQASIDLVRGLAAGVLLAMFVGLWAWAFAAKRRKAFESAALLPLEEDRFQGDAP